MCKGHDQVPDWVRDMNFPLKASPGTLEIPSEPLCLKCRKKIGEIEGFIRLTTGAVLYPTKKRDWGGPSDKMETVFELWYHGPHPVIGIAENGLPMIGMDNQEFTMDIVEPLRGGQVDIHFCSTPCLSLFFSEIVASFDAGIARATTPNP